MSDDLIKREDAPEQISVSQGHDGWRWPRVSKFPEQGDHENIKYIRADLIEELERERDEAVTKRTIAEGLAGLKAFGIDGHSAMITLARDQVGKRTETEAKLAKAAEFIQEVRRNGDTRLASMAIAVLAELERMK